MRIHLFQHVPFEGLGSIEGWAHDRGATISWTRFFDPHLRPGSEIPSLAEIDLLIALGGPMSVNDDEELPWLSAEKRFVADAVEAGKPVLGICLGAQLIASALGARVYPGTEKEIGWFPISGTEGANASDISPFPHQIEVFHWHGETFDLPPGAVRLASSPVTPNQAFRIGARTIGLQFHLETTPESAEELIAHCGDELVPGGRHIQSAEEMRSAPPERYAAINALMREVLDGIVR